MVMTAEIIWERAAKGARPGRELEHQRRYMGYRKVVTTGNMLLTSQPQIDHLCLDIAQVRVQRRQPWPDFWLAASTCPGPYKYLTIQPPSKSRPTRVLVGRNPEGGHDIASLDRSCQGQIKSMVHGMLRAMRKPKAGAEDSGAGLSMALQGLGMSPIPGSVPDLDSMVLLSGEHMPALMSMLVFSTDRQGIRCSVTPLAPANQFNMFLAMGESPSSQPFIDFGGMAFIKPGVWE